MKIKILLISVVLLLFFSLTTIIYAQNREKVEVTIPTTDVRINGTVIDNLHSKYPMLVYKDVLYLPLTEGYSRALGIITSWYKDEEFIIVQDYNSDAPVQTLTEYNNLNAKYYAQVLNTKMSIKEEEVINIQEEYPFLIFRDTVYLPITEKYVEKFLWMIFKDDKSVLSLLANPSNLYVHTIVGDTIYFEEDFKVYKMNTDGSEKTMFADIGRVHEMIVQEDWIYYVNGDDDSKLYKVRTDGTEKTKLSDENIAELVGVDDYIYFSKGGNYSYSKPNAVYKVDLDGNGEKIINGLELGFFAYPQLVDGWIYFNNIEDEDKLYKIRTNGKDKTKLNDYEVENPQIIDEWLYYIDRSDYHIYKAKLDGSEKTKINNEKAYRFTICKDWIYFSNEEDRETLYKVRLDGSDRIKLNNDRTNIIGAHGDWIYFRDFFGSSVYPLSFARINTNDHSREVLLPNGPTKYYYIDGQRVEEKNSGEWLLNNLQISYFEMSDDLASSIEIIENDSSKISFVKYNADYMGSYSNITLHEVKIDEESERLIHTSDKETSFIHGLEVDGRYIKWEELYLEGTDFFVNIYAYDLNSNKKILIKENINCTLSRSYYRIHTSMENNYVTWIENDESKNKSYVKLYDLSSQVEKTIASIDFIDEEDSRRIPVTIVDLDNGKLIFDEKLNTAYYYNIYDIEKGSIIKRIKVLNKSFVHFGCDYDSENDLLAVYFAAEDRNGFYGELGYVDLKRNKYYKIERHKSYETIYNDRIQLENGYLAYNIQQYVSGYINDHYSGYVHDLKNKKTIELKGSFELKLYKDHISNLSFDEEESTNKINYELMRIDQAFKHKN